MHRGGDDALARSSFSFGDVRGTAKSSGGGASDAKTAAQLRKLQRLVETLVVRELERGDSPLELSSQQDAREHFERRQKQHHPQRILNHRGQVPYLYSANGHASAGAVGGGSGSRNPPGYMSSTHSDHSSSLGQHGSGGGGAASGPRVSGGRPLASSLGAGLDEGVHLQVAALQGQLAVLNEQINSAYRAAEGVASPHAVGVGAAAPGVPSGLRMQAAVGSNGAMAGSADPATSGPQSMFLGGPARSTSPVGLQQPLAARQHYLTASGLSGGVPRMGSPLPHRTGAFPVAGTAIAGDPFLDGISASSGGGLMSSTRSRQAAEERAGREANAREDERLRAWIQELRMERRRLEDRLLDGDSGGASGVQQLREDLEKQVLSLSRQRDQLAAELNELGISKATNAQLAGQVEALEAALAAEAERVGRYKEVRPALEGRLAEVSACLEALRRQHAAAVETLVQERDAVVLRAKRGAKRVTELESALDSASADVRRLQDEVRSQVVTMAEMRASSDVLQSASHQMQANMETQAKDAATRLATVQAQLESSQSGCAILRRQLEAAQQEVAALRDQLRDATARLEAQAAERERLAGSLTEEQRALAAARQQAESWAAQLKASEEGRTDVARAAAAQLEAVRRQHAADLAATQKQYESQLAVAEKQYLLLQRQYDAGLASSDVATEAAAALRRERDALWAEAQNLRAELEDARKEKSEVAAKLTALRSEVRATMEEVAKDRDARLASAAAQQEAAVRDVRAEAERRVAAVRQECEAKLSGAVDSADKLRSEVQEAQRQADKYRTTVNHLKDQVRDLLLSRDAAERELASERAFNEELNRILTTIRAEQQQHNMQSHHHGSSFRLSSPDN